MLSGNGSNPSMSGIVLKENYHIAKNGILTGQLVENYLEHFTGGLFVLSTIMRTSSWRGNLVVCSVVLNTSMLQ